LFDGAGTDAPATIMFMGLQFASYAQALHCIDTDAEEARCFSSAYQPHTRTTFVLPCFAQRQVPKPIATSPVN
jgi:hypothetical protein